MELPNTDKIRILMIEDCKNDVFLFQNLLGPIEGLCAITDVPRMIDGFKEINHHAFDLIILDLNLLDLDGTANIAALKAQTPQTPIIVYSGRNDATLKKEAHRVGASGFIVKGETSATLLQETLSLALAS